MFNKTVDMNGAGAGEPIAGDRHFPDLGPVYADTRTNAANVKAQGAANRMWQKVKDDLDRIDHAEIEEADDE